MRNNEHEYIDRSLQDKHLKYQRLRFFPGRSCQAAELNELQSYVFRTINQQNMLISKGLMFLEPPEEITITRNLISINKSRVFFQGFSVHVSESSIRVSSGQYLCLKFSEVIIRPPAEGESRDGFDESLLDPHESAENRGYPGAERSYITGEWAVDDGIQIWKRLGDDLEFLLNHPPSWSQMSQVVKAEGDSVSIDCFKGGRVSLDVTGAGESLTVNFLNFPKSQTLSLSVLNKGSVDTSLEVDGFSFDRNSKVAANKLHFYSLTKNNVGAFALFTSDLVAPES